MDYFQGVVIEYLRADRSMFVNTECLLQLDPGDNFGKGRHWYCDVVAVSFRKEAVYLCEITYSRSLGSLFDRLNAWSTHWGELRAAICRDCGIPDGWDVKPRVFIPKDCMTIYKKKLASLDSSTNGEGQMPKPLVTYMESVLPWTYCSWDRKEDKIENHY